MIFYIFIPAEFFTSFVSLIMNIDLYVVDRMTTTKTIRVLCYHWPIPNAIRIEFLCQKLQIELIILMHPKTTNKSRKYKKCLQFHFSIQFATAHKIRIEIKQKVQKILKVVNRDYKINCLYFIKYTTTTFFEHLFTRSV